MKAVAGKRYVLSIPFVRGVRVRKSRRSTFALRRKPARRRTGPHLRFRRHTVRPCSLCPLVRPGKRVNPARIPISQYTTAQPEALAAFLARHYPGIDISQRFCRECLTHVERSLQESQIIREGEHVYFADVTLGSERILPTERRMDAARKYSGRGVTIAFVDSGFYPHPDLNHPENRVLAYYDAVSNTSARIGGPLEGIAPEISDWHGTMTVSTAAGSGYLSGGRYRGLACDARLVLVRAMNARFGIKTPEVVRALRWILRFRKQYDIRIVNMSLGVDEVAESEQHPVIALVEELTADGVTIVAASGNNPFEVIKPPGAAPSAITVGGYNDRNSTDWTLRQLWHYSRGQTASGLTKPEILAPSIWVAAPILHSTQVKTEADALFRMAAADDDELMLLIPLLATRTNVSDRLLAATTPLFARSIILNRISQEKLISRDYKHVDGTSFAAPIVSSIIARMLEANPRLTPPTIKSILISTAVPLPDIPRSIQGYGVVREEMAVRMAEEIGGSEIG